MRNGAAFRRATRFGATESDLDNWVNFRIPLLHGAYGALSRPENGHEICPRLRFQNADKFLAVFPPGPPVFRPR